MSASLRSLTSLLAALLAAAGVSLATAAERTASITFVEASEAHDFQPPVPVTAIGVRAEGGPKAAAATHVLVLVDTSASQTGGYRQRALEAVTGLLDAARGEDQFLVAAADVDVTPLADGFTPSRGEACRKARLALDARTPLGSTDLIAILESAASLFPEDDGPRAIVYVGDGPGLTGIDPIEFGAAVGGLRDRRIAFTALGIGPRINWQSLAAVASATGGMLVVPAADEEAKAAGAHAGGLAVAPVLWTDKVVLTGATLDVPLRMLPAWMPPLRTDRDSVILVAGDITSGHMELTFAADSGVTLEVPTAEPLADNTYLAELARNAWTTDGVFLPLLGRESLAIARGVVRDEAATLAALSRQAESAGAHASAVRLAQASLRRDPDNPEAALVREVAQQRVVTGGDELPAPAALPADPEGDVAELAELNAMRKVRAQQLEQETALRMRDARTLLTTDPDRARDMLKEARALVDASDDLDAGTRDRLLRQLEMRIRESILRSREKVERDLATERRAAIGRERARLNTELQRREERIKQLTERYNALLDEGIRLNYVRTGRYPVVINDEAVVGTDPPSDAFLEAERGPADQIAELAPNIYANYPINMNARTLGRQAPMVARILQYDSWNNAVERDQQRGFMDMMHSVDLAAIPIPDEPPIIYPDRDAWLELTEKRKKYKSVDLANPTRNEKRIYEALEQTVTQTFEFEETPLRAAIQQLQDEFDIPIVPDVQALNDAGIDLDATTVTQKLSGISLRSALRLLLKDAGLTYLVKDEVLLITTAEKAKEELIVKVYPVADLVMPVNPSGGVNPFQQGGGMGGGNSFNSGMGMGGGGMGGGGMGMGGGGFCWLAREVYGSHDPRWLVFRGWMMQEAPPWLRSLYAAHGEAAADWIADKPLAKAVVRAAMDHVVAPRMPAAPAMAGAFQVTEAKARLAKREKVSTPAAAKPATPAPTDEPTDDGVGLPEAVLEATDLGRALHDYLVDGPADERDAAMRMAQVRVSAADLGKAERFDRAADLLSAAIACGKAESWMYESLAVAMEAAGRPRADVERVLLSTADFAATPTDLLLLANYLARFGSDKQAIRIYRQVTRLDPANREAYALAMTIAARNEDVGTLRWACPGVLGHDWPASQREIAVRAARLAKATIESLTKDGRQEEADAFQAVVDQALVRDVIIEFAWTGDADIDVVVEEPPGTVCSVTAPRSTSGGTLLGDDALPETDGSPVHRERYVATEAFPGTYRVLVTRVWGKVAADTVTAEMTIHAGTDHEQKIRRRLRLGAEGHLFEVEVPEGRRRQSLLDAQIAQDVVVQQNIGKAVLAQQLAALADPAVAASMSQSRGGTGTGPQAGGLPFFGPGGAVGYQPIISTLPEGTNIATTAVVSADRRYVRVTPTPLFSGVGQVTTFNFAGGGASGGGMGGGGMGGGGMGGGGMGGGGMGGMGGGGMGGMGGGGMGGMGGGGMGGMGGGGMGGFCWVAREVYGADDPRWLAFRHWLLSSAPGWLRETYRVHGPEFAHWIHDKPAVKAVLRFLMDRAIASSTEARAACARCPRSE